MSKSNGFYDVLHLKKEDVIKLMVTSVTLSYNVQTQILRSIRRTEDRTTSIDETIENIVKNDSYRLTVIDRQLYLNSADANDLMSYGEVCLSGSFKDGDRFLYCYMNLQNFKKLVKMFNLKLTEI